MQTDSYSLDAQKARMKAYADYNDYEMVNLICVEDGIDSYQHQNSCFWRNVDFCPFFKGSCSSFLQNPVPIPSISLVLDRQLLFSMKI